MNGRGKITFGLGDEKDYYEGDFKNGQRWGQGKLLWKNGDSYEGGWEKDKRSGFGVLVNGKQNYMGDWKDDKRSGNGVKTLLESGAQYHGQFENDVMHGNGSYTYEKSSEFSFYNG
jgi:hypothetical protein